MSHDHDHPHEPIGHGGEPPAAARARALEELLVAKGVITPDEYMKAIADRMEEEAAGYEKELTARVGRPVTLGEAGPEVEQPEHW